MSIPYRSPPLWTRRTGDVVTVYGEVDIATCDLFRAAVDAVIEAAEARAERDGAHLDLAGLEFIDIAGARVLVVAATKCHPRFPLVVHHPSAMLARVVELGWGKVPGLELVQRRSTDARSDDGHRQEEHAQEREPDELGNWSDEVPQQ